MKQKGQNSENINFIAFRMGKPIKLLWYWENTNVWFVNFWESGLDWEKIPNDLDKYLYPGNKNIIFEGAFYSQDTPSYFSWKSMININYYEN